MTRRQGFTLIELMIAMAVSVILVTAVFAANFRITDTWRSERVRQALQQNFRFALDAVTTEIRQATTIVSPGPDSLADELTFAYVATPAPSETRKLVSYRRVGTGSFHVERWEKSLVYQAGSWVDPDPGVWSSKTPVSEDIETLAALHFVHRGSNIVSILVAQYKAGGATRTICYTAQTAVRSLPLATGNP